MFESVTRVGSGCTLDELAELSRKLEPHWRRTKPGYVPPSHLWTRERPELWLEPMDSVIVQVRSQQCNVHKIFARGNLWYNLTYEGHP